MVIYKTNPGCDKLYVCDNNRMKLFLIWNTLFCDEIWWWDTKWKIL